MGQNAAQSMKLYWVELSVLSLIVSWAAVVSVLGDEYDTAHLNWMLVLSFAAMGLEFGLSLKKAMKYRLFQGALHLALGFWFSFLFLGFLFAEDCRTGMGCTGFGEFPALVQEATRYFFAGIALALFAPAQALFRRDDLTFA
jgi:hypothetical protein